MMTRTMVAAACVALFVGAPCAAVVASGETYTWTGAVDNTWNKADNWEGGKVFVSSLENDLVINKANAPIPAGLNAKTITFNAQVTQSYMGAGITVAEAIYCVAGGLQMQFTGNIELAGENVVFDLSGGSIGFHNTGSRQYVSGAGGLTLTKSGSGGGSLSAGAGCITYTFTGPFTIQNGVSHSISSYSPTLATKKIDVLEGAELSINATNLNPETELKIANSSFVTVAANVRQTIKALYLDGSKCAPGIWGNPNAVGVEHVTLRLKGTGTLLVTDQDGTFEDGVLWTGIERHWTAAANGNWATASNWAENEVPVDYDDVIIQSTATMSFPSTAPAIHNLTCEKAFTVANYGCKFLLAGDLTLKGGNFSFPWGGFTLLAGQHVIDTGAYSMNSRDMRIDGVGGLTKRGSGSINPTSATTNPHNLSFKGPLRIEGGVFGAQAAMNSATTNVVVTGETSILAIDGASVALNTNAVVRLENRGRIRVVSGNTLIVKELWIDGKKCAAGTWGLPSTSADHKTLRIINPGLVKVREGGDYEGGDLWTGRTCTWLGTVSSTWTAPDNWKDGEVAADYDDVIFDANYVNQPSVPNPFTFHNLILNKGYSSTYVNPFQASGGIYCVGGGLSFGYSGTIEALSKATVLDLTGGSISLSPNSGNRHHYLSGNGGFVVTKAPGSAGGSLTVDSGNGVHVVFKGALRIEHGVQFDMKAGDGVSTKDVTVTGEGSLVKFHAAKLPTDATVRIENGGIVALVGNFTNDIERLVLGGWERYTRTYGGPGSPAERRLAKYFVAKEGKNDNLGVFRVTAVNPNGTLLMIK